MSKPHSTLVDGLVSKSWKSARKWQVFRTDFCHFKMCLYALELVQEMVYDGAGAPTTVPFGRSSATSVRMYACEIGRRR